MEAMSNGRNNIQYLELSDAAKKEFLDGFDRGLKDGAASASRIWELEKLTIDETESIISLLAEDRNSWNIEDGQFFFETDEQIDRFNKHLANIEKFYAERMEMQDRAIDRQRKAIDEL